LRGYEQVIGADRRALRLKGGADVPRFCGVVEIEGGLLETARQ